ncbi:glycine betaine ABC transporter substrate-binding protein [Clostridium sp.]|jgi:taurine transport system substrate-binding protein|uniref:taurine ABC transporter substrate-binding protein n=1 Tax=Clostridium sp. TaxID=1506 RepID=UPI00258720C2|nr:glycine betaine ABC transporter substrate-binding protein [Clostridium sp.]MDF2504985.1 taurine transporter substrate-binding protein [Clostridium sp.]
MLLKKIYKSVFISMLIGVLIIMAGCSNTSGKNSSSSNNSNSLPKEIRIGYMPSPNGELLAKATGAVEKKFPGSKINWIKFDAGRDIITAISSGSIDFGTIGTPPASLGIANSIPYYVYYLDDIIGDSEALIVKNSSGINSVKDLKGKKIATTFSSTSHFSLLNALKLNGVKDTDVTLLDMQMPDILAAWQRNDIDGAYVWETTKSKLLATNGKSIITSGDLAKEGAITGELGIVSKTFADKYPNIIKQYVSVLDESVHEYKNDQQDSAEKLSKELGLSKDETLKAMNEIIVLDAKEQADEKYLGTPEKPGNFAKLLKETGDYLVTQKSIKSSPDLSVYQKAIYNKIYGDSTK